MVVLRVFCFSVVDSTQRKGTEVVCGGKNNWNQKFPKNSWMEGVNLSIFGPTLRWGAALVTVECHQRFLPQLGRNFSEPHYQMRRRNKMFDVNKANKQEKKHCWPRSVLVLEYFWEENSIKPQDETSQPVFFLRWLQPDFFLAADDMLYPQLRTFSSELRLFMGAAVSIASAVRTLGPLAVKGVWHLMVCRCLLAVFRMWKKHISQIF